MAAQTLVWHHLTDVLNNFGKALVEEYVKNIDERHINASRNLAQSVKYEVVSGDRWVGVDISLAEYWKYVEYGRKAGKFPPLSNIEEWIKVKGITPMTRTQASVKRWTSYTGELRRNDGRIPGIKSLAYLIGRKIAKEGIQPRPILATSVDEVLSQMEEAINEAIDRDIAESVDIIMAEIYKME